MKTISLLVITLLCASVFADQFGFSLQYVGQCLLSDVYICSLKASSEQIATQINSAGNVSETINTVIGSLSAAILVKPFKTSNSFIGNTTFGIHQTHIGHYLEFSGYWSDDVSEVGNTISCFSADGLISDGAGTWAGASGVIGFAGCTNSVDGTTIIVSTARVFVPASPPPPPSRNWNQ